MSAAFFPRPTESWPWWAHVLYWAVVFLTVAAMAIKTFMKSFARIEQGYIGVRMRFERPIRVSPCKKGVSCKICDERSISCSTCRAGRYCARDECPECPVHDELKIVGPGFHWQVPFTHSMRELSLQDWPVGLPRTAFEYTSSTGKRKLEIDGALTYSVLPGSRAIFRALYAATDLSSMVLELATPALAKAVVTHGPNDLEAIQDTAAEIFNERASRYGVRAVQFIVKPVTRTDAQVIAEALAVIAPDATPQAAAVVGSSHLELIQGS